MRRAEQFANSLLRHRYLLLGVAAVAFAAAWLPSRSLTYNRSIDGMFPRNDRRVAALRTIRRLFRDDAVVLAAYRDLELLSVKGLERLRRLADQIKRVRGVAKVRCLADLPLTQGALASLAIDREPILEFVQGWLIGADRATTAVVCLLADEASSPVSRRETLEELRHLVQRHNPPAVLAGQPLLVTEGFAMLEQDGRRLATLSVGLLMLVVAALFRQLRWMLLPGMVVWWSLTVSQGVLWLAGFQLTMVSSMLTSVIAVIGVAAAMHFIVRYEAGLLAGAKPEVAFQHAAARLAAPILWSILTDIVGFASLQAIQVDPVRDYSVMMITGCLAILAALILIAPCLAFLGPNGTNPPPRRGVESRIAGSPSHPARPPALWLDRLMRTFGQWSLRHSRSLTGASAVMAILSALGLAQLQVESDFTRNFRAGSGIAQAHRFVDQHLGGAGVWDVLVPMPRPVTHEWLDSLDAFKTALLGRAAGGDPRHVGMDHDLFEEASSPLLAKVVGVPDAMDLLHSIPGGRLARAVGPEAQLALLGTLLPDVASMFWAEDAAHGASRQARIMLRAREAARAEDKKALCRRAEELAETLLPGAVVTGPYLLTSELTSSLMRGQAPACALAAGGIGLMLWLATRQAHLAWIALATNLLPVLVLTGTMGWLGVRANLGAAMITSVTIGLSVDASLHYLIEFRRARGDGLPFSDAVVHAHRGVGPALLFATLALLVGFGALAVSEFLPTVWFGGMMSATLLGGLAGNLFLLPAILKAVLGDDRGAG